MHWCVCVRVEPFFPIFSIATLGERVFFLGRETPALPSLWLIGDPNERNEGVGLGGKISADGCDFPVFRFRKGT